MGLWTDPDARRGSSYEWLHQPLRPVTPPPPPPPAPPRRRTGRLIAAVRGTIILVAVLVAVAVTLIDDRSGNGTTQAVAPLPISRGGTARTRINEIYKRVQAAVVSIAVTEGNGRASGSGFVIDGNGTIVTNDHVVEDATSVRARFDDKGSAVRALVIGTDPSSDIAVLRPAASAPRVRPLTLADSSKVQVGDNAIA